MALTMQIPRLSMIIHHASQVIELHGNETLHKCKRNHGPVSISICAKQAIAVISTFCCKASSYWCTRVCVYWCTIRKSENETELKVAVLCGVASVMIRILSSSLGLLQLIVKGRCNLRPCAGRPCAGGCPFRGSYRFVCWEFRLIGLLSLVFRGHALRNLPLRRI